MMSATFIFLASTSSTTAWRIKPGQDRLGGAGLFDAQLG